MLPIRVRARTLSLRFDRRFTGAWETQVTRSGALPDDGAMDELSVRDREILTFERDWWQYAGAKDAAVREHLALEPEAYYRALTSIIDLPAALDHDPLLVRRLRRQRLARQRERQARRQGLGRP